MDVAHGPNPVHTVGVSAGATSPPRPAVPPKPDREKIGGVLKTNAETQANLFRPRRFSATDAHPAARNSAFVSTGAGGVFPPPNCRNSIPSSSDSGGCTSPQSPTPVLTSPGSSQTPRAKPALPPKPNTSLLTSPPITKFLQKSPPQFPPQLVTDNNNKVNGSSHGIVNGEQNGGLHSPPTFLRTKPPPCPGDPLSPRVVPRPPVRPNSAAVFNFSSPIHTLNSANFPSTSGGLNQSGGTAGFTAPTPERLAQIRVKSASLGRNITFPFSPPSSSSGGGGIGGIFSRKSATLSKFLPLDLHLGNSSRVPPPLPNNKPNALNLNPFIVRQKEQQELASKSVQPQNSVKSFGRQISFSPDSAVPPPPPPRLRRKLSPVNSVGSPTSPTSPSPFNSSLSPTSPLPPAPLSPGVLGMESVLELGEDREALAIYAEVDKQKKWEERKLKQIRCSSETASTPDKSSITSSFSFSPTFTKSPSSHNFNINQPPNAVISEHTPSQKSTSEPPDENLNSVISGESAVVDSWLGKYLTNSITSTANPFTPKFPAYQPSKTSHIYETINDDLHLVDDGNNNNHIATKKDTVEISESSQPINDQLSENQSFLFKLVISHKKVDENAQPPTAEGDEVENLKQSEDEMTKESSDKPIPTEALVQSSVTDTSAEQTQEKVSSPQKEEFLQISSSPVDTVDSCIIPTVVQDLSQTPQTETNAHDSGTPQKDVVLERQSSPTKPSDANELSQEEESFKSAISSVHTESTVVLSTSRSNSILRRRSWNCDRVESPCPSDSSSTASSINGGSTSGFPRDCSFIAIKDRGILHRDHWVDEGDLSNGALGDAESSDAPLRSSAEDLRGASGVTFASGADGPTLSGFAKRRSKLVNSIFGSFGKGSSSSSGSGGKKGVVMRHSAGNKRRNEKSQSTFFPSDIYKPDVGSKLGRQVSDSVIHSAKLISVPILPNASLSQEDNSPLPHKPQLVQFSPDVSETRIIYHEHYSSEDTQNLPPAMVFGEDGDRPDNESVSSSESASGCGSVSSHEEILAELSPKEKKSFYVAREILTSERTFVDVLNLLTVDFPKSLSIAHKFHGSPVISPGDLTRALGGLQTLKKVNEDLLLDLEERVANWRESPKIADILVKKGPFLKLYATYIKDFQNNSILFDTCCQKYPLFAATVRDFEMSDRCHKLGLKHYMLKPVQRMPQYRLLLEDYLKSLDEDSEDYEDTVKGIAIVKEVAEHANEAIRLQVNAEKLLHLQNRLTAGTIILKSDRQLIIEGELHKVCRKVLQPRFFALMNDCLLMLTYNAQSPKDLKLRYELPLAGMRVSLSPAEDYQNEFSVISVTRSFNLVAKTPKERDEWMKALNNAINDNIKKRTCSTPDQELRCQLGKEAPVWTQDSRVTMCQLCTAEFTVMFRRHHCRACGKVVCGNCSGNDAPLQYLKNEAARVCDCCFEYLLEEFDTISFQAINDTDRNRSFVREKFKKVTPNVTKRATKIKSKVPSRLEVHANSSGSRISGYLQWREREKKSWKRRWFVLIDRVLYIYAASEDIVAIKSIPILGWTVEMDKTEPQESEETMYIFRLTHLGQHPILFQTDSSAAAEKWAAAMSEAVVF